MPATFDKEGALSRVDGDTSFLKDLIRICKDQCRSRLPAMEGMLRVEDFSSMASNAHALKGSLGNLGADAASAAASKLEFAAKEGDVLSMSDLLASLLVEVEEFFEVAEQEL